MAAELSIIDSLPLPSTIDLPPLGQLPSLPPAVTVVGISSEPSSSILNPLPPPLPLDTYDTQYGPSSPSEPQLDPAVSSPQDGELPSFDEVNDQYDFLRRTLSHSRGRYSARYKRPRPKPKPKEEDSEEQSSLDMPGKKREDSAINESPYKIKPPSAGPHPLAKRHTVQGSKNVHQRSHAQSKGMEQRRSSPATVRAKHVDSLGRNYVIDHQTHTVQYGSPSEGSENVPNFTGRREMLNRRYESLQRSFRSAHHHRRIQTNNNLSPGETAGAISYLPGERQESSEEVSVPSPVTRGSKKEQKSEKKSRWFGFGRKSNRSISQTTPDPQEDNIIPIASPSSILSPITPPPSLDDLEISLPPPLTSPQPVVMPNGGLESSVGVLEPGQGNGNGGNRDSVTAILDAMNTVQPRPQSTHTQDQEETGAVAAPLSSPTHRATDIDKIAETQRRISRTKRQRKPRTDDGGDTDEETDILSPRISVTSNDRPGSATGGERGTTPGSTDSGSREERTQPTSSDSAAGEGERGGEEVGVATKEEEEEGDPQSFTRQRASGSKRKMSKGLVESPALKFITRPDLYTFLNSSGEAGEEFFSNRALVELVQRIRTQTNLFEKYQHSRQLVKTLNKFADTESELPDGWEKKLNKQGRIFFIDHDNCLTTFIDPRLPLDSEQSNIKKTSSISAPQSVRRVYSVSEEPELRAHHTTVGQSMSLPSEPAQPEETTTERASYESQIVAFLRQPNVIDKINRRYGRGVKPHLAEAIEDIQQSGIPGLERIQLAGGTAAYELGLILSIFDEEVNAISPQQQQQNTMTTPNITVTSASSHPDGAADDEGTLQRQKQAFSAKLQTFKLQLARLGFAQSSRLKFNLRRDHLLEDAYEHIMKSEIRHLQRKRLNIAFKGEEGLDYGGPSREFFFLVSREIFNPYFGLFEYSANDTYTVQISSTSCFIRNNLDWLRFAGRIIGLTIAQGFLLDVFFTRPFYKLLLKRPPTLKDLESLEPSFYSSLLWIKENDPAPLDLTFSVEEEAFGQLTTHELKEGGLDIPVLEENKTEYIDLMLKWRLDRGTQEQSAALMKGFNEIMPVSLIQQFDAQELEFIIAGTLEIDIDDWRANTDYRNGYNANHPVVLWFWKAVEMFDNEQRLRLLQFITGTSSVPYEGFKALRGSSGPKRFTIDFFNDVRSLPRSHTCFNRLDLPPYPSFEILYEKLRVAIEEGGTFGVE